MSELTDACEALTLDKEQLALENEELQASWLLNSQRARASDTGTLAKVKVVSCFLCGNMIRLAPFCFLAVS